MSDINNDNENDNIINSWDDLDIKPQLLRGIYAYGLKSLVQFACRILI